MDQWAVQLPKTVSRQVAKDAKKNNTILLGALGEIPFFHDSVRDLLWRSKLG